MTGSQEVSEKPKQKRGAKNKDIRRPEPERRHTPKDRKCLSGEVCGGVTYRSTWVGDRICPRCRAGHTWQSQ